MELDRKTEIGQQAIPKDEGLELFVAVMELVEKHGDWAVIDELTEIVGYEAEDADFWPPLQREKTWLRLELLQLSDRFRLLFVDDAVEQVNYDGPVMVQMELDLNHNDQRIEEAKSIFPEGN